MTQGPRRKPRAFFVGDHATMLAMSARFLLCFLLAALAGDLAAQTAAIARPRIGLVVAGGGARGLAHVGALKVLEAERIPIDVIAGTSMGAIVGGLYASGMSATELERELLKVDWSSVFTARVDRQYLAQRRKEEDFEISSLIELGIRDGELRTPTGAVSTRGLESLLRRYTLPVRAVQDFARLPIPFRAVTTDLETGAEVVLSSGDLGTPLAARDSLNSVLGVTTQMINILTGQNVQRDLANITSRDVLVSPALGKLGPGDFDKVADAIANGAQVALPRLQSLTVTPEVYAQRRAEHPKLRRPEATVGFISFEGSKQTHAARFVAQLEPQPGQPFSVRAAERDARSLAASRTSYAPTTVW